MRSLFSPLRPPPRRVVPALLCFGKDGGSGSPGCVHALRYVTWATEALGCQDTAVHNLAVALHSQVGPTDNDVPLGAGVH